jgi:type I restriction enzyme, S subunit
VTVLPPSWAEATLGDIAETRLGKMLSAKARGGPNPRPYLRNKNVQWGRFDLSDLLVMDFDDEEFERFRVVLGDLLVCEGGEVGRAAIWRGEIAGVGYQKALHRVRPASGVVAEYLLYAFRWFADTHAFESFITGSTISHLPQEDLRRLPVPLPPEAEQRRIVAGIEKHFSRLDAAEELLRRARSRLARLRDIAMDRAFAGDWAWASTGDVAEVQGGIQKQPKRRPVMNKAPFLRVANVLRGRLDLADVHEVELFEGELDRYRLMSGDLLVVEGNGSIEQIGRCALWRDEIANCVHQNHLIRVRPGPGVLPTFLNAYWNSPTARQRVAEVASSTSGLYTLSTAKVKAVPVPIVPLAEQQRIVSDVERQLSIIDAQLAAIEAAVRRSAALRRSILKLAFTGKLAPQDPSDEPASVLLERIATERAAAPLPSRRRRKIPA